MNIKMMDQEDLARLVSLLRAYTTDPDLTGEAMQLVNAGFETECVFDNRQGKIAHDQVLLFGYLELKRGTIHIVMNGYRLSDRKSWVFTCSFGPSVSPYSFPAKARRTYEASSALEALTEGLKDSVAWLMHQCRFVELYGRYINESKHLLDTYRSEAADWIRGDAVEPEPDHDRLGD